MATFSKNFALTTVAQQTADGTTVTTVGPTIIGNDGTSYSINSSAQVAANGTGDGLTAAVISLYFIHGYIYYQTSATNWFTKRLVTDQWVQTWEPVVQIADSGKQYYINSSTGSDSNTGLAPNQAFATMAKFAGLSGAGTVANVAGNTTYTAGAFFSVSNSGTNGHRCVLQWDGVGAKPIINLTSGDGNGFVVQANWIDFIGIVVQGSAQTITLQNAKDFSAAFQTPNVANQIGFNYGQRGNRITQHHIRVINCEFYDCGQSGINLNFMDYAVVVNNIVARCSWYSTFGSSGISIYGSHDVDGNTSYKTFVANNICYENQQKVPTNGGTDFSANGISDGENIILDDNSNDQTDSVAYNGRTLVIGNQCSLSGRSNIQAFAGANADIIYNTCYGACQVVSTDGQIYMHNYSGTNHVGNNILVATVSGDATLKIDAGSGTTFDYNIHSGGTPSNHSGAHDRVIDPLFVNAAARNFQLQATSPARNSSDPAWAYNVADIIGANRPKLNASLGAYQ